MQNHFCLKTARGQSGLIVVAVGVLLAFLVVGLSVSFLNQSNTQRALRIEKSLETLYVARAGIEEALASRHVPRANKLALLNGWTNFSTESFAVPNTGSAPFNGNSGMGYVYPTPGSPSVAGRQVLGIYRFHIFGGDPLRDPVSGDWLTPLAQLPTDVVRQAFYVVSEGAVCRRQTLNREPVYGGIIFSPGNNNVQCSRGLQLDRVTLVSRVDFSRLATPNKDVVDTIQVALNPDSIQLKNPLTGAPEPVWSHCVGGSGGVSSTINFDSTYDCRVIPTLHRALFYQPGAASSVQVVSINEKYGPKDVQGPTNLTLPLPVVRLIWEGPINPWSACKCGEAGVRACTAAEAANLGKCLSSPEISRVRIRVKSLNLPSLPPVGGGSTAGGSETCPEGSIPRSATCLPSGRVINGCCPIGQPAACNTYPGGNEAFVCKQTGVVIIGQ